MQAGKLDRQIQLLEYSSTTDTVGGDVPTYTPVGLVWANVMDLRGNQKFAAQQEQSGITTRFRIRYREDINARWRVMWKGRQYDIIGAISEIGRNEGLEFDAKARDEI